MTQERERTPGRPARLATPGGAAGPVPPDARVPGAAPARVPSPPAPPAGHRVLIVEDEPALLRALRINLRARGYDVATALTGQEALTQLQRRPPDAVLLDLGLPDLDGTEVIRRLRSLSRVPVIVLSGRAGPGDKIGALDAGADDYVTKPFSMEELLARLRAALRREDRPPDGTTFTIGRHLIDLAAHTVIRTPAPPDTDPASTDPASTDPAATSPEDTDPAATSPEDTSPAGSPDNTDLDSPDPVHLTRTEWRLLGILLHAPGQLVSSDRLLNEVWGPGFEHGTHHLRFHMARLRRKLEDDPPRPRHLLTEPGMGYRYQP